MEIILFIIFMVALSLLASKSLYDMPNPGRRFYDRLYNDKEKKDEDKY